MPQIELEHEQFGGKKKKPCIKVYILFSQELQWFYSPLQQSFQLLSSSSSLRHTNNKREEIQWSI